MAVCHLYAQSQTVTGRVVDESGRPVAGASVQVRGNKVGTATDASGAFTIKVPANAKSLSVTSLNYTD